MSDTNPPGSPALGPVARRLAASQRVLCVEDEQDIADFLRAYFRASGYDLVHIDPDQPDDVIQAMIEHSPDCVLLDLRLRGFSGKEAYRLIRADERWAFVPVIVVSAQDLAGPITAGIDGYVSKPFNVNSLADVVRSAIERAKELETEGHHEQFGVMSEQYLRTRLIDEVHAVVEDSQPLSFALVHLQSLGRINQMIGDSATAGVVQEIVRAIRDCLPPEAVLGMTGADELAVVLPGVPVEVAEAAFLRALTGIGSVVTMAGGAELELALVAGLASYPEHANDADELYMAADGALADAREAESGLAVAL